jgi:uncharacterized membrane protein YjjB (DUF3815 family)
VTGRRKMVVVFIGILALLVGLALCVVEGVAVAYGAFATGIVSLVAAFVVGNVGEHFARKDKP